MIVGDKLPVNGIRGWYFSDEEIKKAQTAGRLLSFDLELGEACPLRCVYCYRSDDSRDREPRVGLNKPLMSFTTWKRVVSEASALGVRSIKLIGGGELTLDPHFRQAMEFLAAKAIIPVLFTSGNVIGDDRLCQKVHACSGYKLARWLYDVGTSVFVKVDSLNQTLQDRLAGSPGYTAVRDRAIQILLDLGFQRGNPTRLGLEVNVNRFNLAEILDIYSLREKYGLYEDVVVSMPCDAYIRNPDYDISLSEKRELYRRIHEFNRQNSIPTAGASPFIGGLCCTQLAYALYVNNRGDVYHCPGTFKCLGNVHNTPLPTVWERLQDRFRCQEPYFCPFREESAIIPSGLVAEIRADLAASASIRT